MRDELLSELCLVSFKCSYIANKTFHSRLVSNLQLSATPALSPEVMSDIASGSIKGCRVYLFFLCLRQMHCVYRVMRRSIRSFNIPHWTTDGHLIIVRTGRWGTLTLLGGVRNLNRKCRVYPTLYTCSNGGKESASVGKWMKKTCFTM